MSRSSVTWRNSALSLPHLVLMTDILLFLSGRRAVTLEPGINTVGRNPKPSGYFSNRMLPLRHLPDGFNLEFFRVTLLFAYDTSR